MGSKKLAEPGDGIAVAIAVRPKSCLGKREGIEPLPRLIDSPENCLRIVRELLQELSEGQEIAACVVSMFGDIDSEKREFLSSAGEEEWRHKIEFDLLKECISGKDPEKLVVLNDATASAFHVFQASNFEKKDDPLLVIIVRHWGIGFGLVHKDRPWMLVRNPELGHIPAMRVRVGGDTPVDDIPLNKCKHHNDRTFPCITNLASGAAADERNSDKIFRAQLRKATGSSHEYEAIYLAQACVAGAAAYRPSRIVVTGSYLNNTIVKRVRTWFGRFTNNFPQRPPANFISYIATTDDSDIDGAFGYAQVLVHRMQSTSSLSRPILR